MKRSPALVALSHDHHHALDAARRLRRATEGDAAEAIAHFRAFWEAGGHVHFLVEEELLLPALPADDEAWGAATRRVRTEHDEIRALAAALDGLDVAHELGERLAAHVRFEERQLFALLEERLPEERLIALGDAIDAAAGADR